MFKSYLNVLGKVVVKDIVLLTSRIVVVIYYALKVCKNSVMQILRLAKVFEE